MKTLNECKEYMYNILGVEAIVREVPTLNGKDKKAIITINEYVIKREFVSYEKAVTFLERRGYRF